MCKIKCLVVILALTSCKCTEHFSAITDMNQLLHFEAFLIENAHNFLIQTRTTLAQIENHLHDLTIKHQSFTQNDYLTNPINAFLLLKRLTVDWKNLEFKAINIPRWYESGIESIVETLGVQPVESDLLGAAFGLVRLQSTYNLSTTDMANGNIRGEISARLTSEDCLELGKALINRDDFHAYLWIKEALNRARSEVKKLSISQQLSVVKRTLQRSQTGNLKLIDEPLPPDEKPGVTLVNSLCREEKVVKSQNLKCKYTRGVYNTILGSFREEQLSLDPAISLFHNVISDGEIEMIQDLAKSKLTRALLYGQSTSEEAFKFRVSKTAGFNSFEHPLIDRIERRLNDMTHLDVLNSGEQMQVVNYGIGGHFIPHFDFLTKKNVQDLTKGLADSAHSTVLEDFVGGNRLATVILYLSEVRQGGATVFPILNVTVFPEKGAALFWYNLHENGEGDLRTLHAACPVLSGSKWIANMWIHEQFQEFNRPCGVERGPVEEDYADISSELYSPPSETDMD